MNPKNFFICRAFITTLAMAVALESVPAYDRGNQVLAAGNGAASTSRSHALRQLEPVQVEKTLAGLEEALGAAKHKGIPPTVELTAKLRDPAQSRLQNISELPKLNREIGRVGQILDQIRTHLDWNGYRLRRLEEWSQAAEADYQAMLGRGKTRRPGYDSQAEASLKKQAEMSRLVVEGVSKLISDFSDLVEGASRFLETAADQGQIHTFQPFSADLLNQILRAGDTDGRRANFLVAFEIQEAQQNSFYLLEGLLDFLRQQEGGNNLVKALLANAGVELFFLEMHSRFIALDSVQAYLRRSGAKEEELLEVYQQLSHLIAEDIERFALGIQFQENGSQLTEQFMEEYSPLDRAISRFIQAGPVAPSAAPTRVPAPPQPPTSSVPSASPAEAVSKRPSYYPSPISTEKYTKGWRVWVRAHVDHGGKPVWNDAGIAVGLPTAKELTASLGLKPKSVAIYGQAARKPVHRHFMPLRAAAKVTKILAEWIAAYNEHNAASPITASPEELFETYRDVSDLIQADGIGRRTEAGRFTRCWLNLKSGHLKY